VSERETHRQTADRWQGGVKVTTGEREDETLQLEEPLPRWIPTCPSIPHVTYNSSDRSLHTCVARIQIYLYLYLLHVYLYTCNTYLYTFVTRVHTYTDIAHTLYSIYCNSYAVSRIHFSHHACDTLQIRYACDTLQIRYTCVARIHLSRILRSCVCKNVMIGPGTFALAVFMLS
jgi:hypothetical protein